MALQDVVIFENQNEIVSKQIGNFGDLDDLTFQVNCDSDFEMQVYGKINSDYPFELISVFSYCRHATTFTVQESGIFNFKIPRKAIFEFRIISIDGGSLNCYATIG